jgi:hypothetical protein
MLARALMGMASAICCGCVNFAPTPLDFPKNDDTSATYSKYTGPAPQATIRDIEAQTWAYFGAWRKAAQNRREGQFLSGEAMFVGAITAAIAAIRESKEGAMIGAGLAGAGSIVQSHYALAIQATNYDAGSKAMHCVYDLMHEIDQGTWDILFDPSTGAFRVGGATEDVKKLSTIPRAANGAIAEIVQKLYTAQANVQLAVPNPKEIRDAFTNYNKAETTAPAKFANRNLFFGVAVSPLASIPDATLDKLLKMPEAFKACVATFS